MAEEKVQLVVRSGPQAGDVYPLSKAQTIVGRDPSCDLVLRDTEVSRYHCMVVHQAGGYVVTDLGSTNGTQVGGERITAPRQLASGDVLRLGSQVVLVFEAEGSPAQGSTVATQAVPVPPLPPPPPVSRERYVAANAVVEGAPPRKNSAFLIALVVVLILFLVGLCLLFLWFIDANFLWCYLLPFLPACP